MSFNVSGSFGASDLTAQQTGNPTTYRPHHDDDDGGAGTRATSVTETGDASPDSRSKEAATPTGAGGAINDSSDSSDDEEEVEMARRNSAVQELARTFTQNSMASTAFVGKNVFESTSDPNSPLNPNGENFNGRAWGRALLDMVSREGGEPRKSGVAFENLNVFGYGTPTDYQKDVFNMVLQAASVFRNLTGDKGRRIDILRNFDGLIRNGEMLVVLGPPGSGCTTLLKTISGEMNGIYTGDESTFNYQGIAAQEMHTQHRGEAIYTAEVDVHFPQLSVGDTLTFAARARAPRKLPGNVSHEAYAAHLRDVIMAMFGISHTINTRVGNEYIRGVSGGERKRVTIAEAALSGAPLQCWDNSTRGLDSANAIEFVRTLRTQSELFGSTACVSIYQAPQAAYDMFHKATVLYEGRQIYFGPATEARQYFIDLGFECAPRATTPDFLTSMTSPKERVVRRGFEGRVPRTPDEFATAWKNSEARRRLLAEIAQYNIDHPVNGHDAEVFRASKRAQQASSQRPKSPYTLSYREQINLCVWRGFRRLIGSPGNTLTMLFGNFIFALIIASVFFDLQPVTSSFYQRGALLFFACLMNAFSSALEILTLYAQRPIVEKHNRYALYHPSAEAVASMLVDMPYKTVNAITFNMPIYFMTNLRREPGPFFFYLLIGYVTVLTMSMIFRTIASASRTLSEALVPAALIILALVVFTGFVIPIDYMLGWCRWMNYIDPLAYAFESLMVNEFHGRDFTCDGIVPAVTMAAYANVSAENHVCSTRGSVAGQNFVNGDAYLNQAMQYYHSHKWRNFGIVIGFLVFFLFTYMVAAELVSEAKSKGEVLLFRRGHQVASKDSYKADAESGTRASAAPPASAGSGEKTALAGPEADGAIQPAPQQTEEDAALEKIRSAAFLERQTSVFHWQNVCYDVKIKSENRRILDHVDGWIKPGTLTALMGVSGAGKTTLLDCLADRVSMGVITGDMFVDGHQRDQSFQRKTGYVQQQDLHLQTTTVREALNFSALLRQPSHVPREEKLAYVDEVIKLLGMQEYAEAVVGVPGEGLNVEQRKRLTIGVELAAKPPLLLFVDEPTSGLDSQTSWSILDLLEKLTKSGQAVLCTIHQPSAMLFQRFDRLLFLAKGGRTVYFGDIGKNSETMTGYFERISGKKCPESANPAEWMLEVIGAAPGSHSDVNWHEAWRGSPEFQAVQEELQRLHDSPAPQPEKSEAEYREFAASFWQQMREVQFRVFEQYWRTPSYIYSKASLCTLVALFIGFVFFKAPVTIQGFQNQMFAIFMLLTVFGQLVQQTMPHFVIQRALYEVRERPSKVYSWRVFMLSQILVELPWNTLMAVIMYFCWYYPIGLYRNAAATGQTAERGFLVFMLLWTFLLFTSTFTDMVIAGLETAEAGGNIANMLFSMCLIFCGVIATPESFPRFWIFMYRVSPFSYLVSAMLSTSVYGAVVTCADNEYLHFDPPSGQTCIEYMQEYIDATGGYVLNESATSGCSFCSVKDASVVLAGVNANFGDRWRNFGIMWVYIIFNIAGALAIYWLVRVPKKRKMGKAD